MWLHRIAVKPVDSKNHKTTIIDTSKENIELVKKRKAPFQEDLINDYLKKYLYKNLSFCEDIKDLSKKKKTLTQ